MGPIRLSSSQRRRMSEQMFIMAALDETIIELCAPSCGMPTSSIKMFYIHRAPVSV